MDNMEFETKETKETKEMKEEKKNNASAMDVLEKLVDIIKAPVDVLYTYAKIPADFAGAKLDAKKQQQKQESEKKQRMDELEVQRNEKKLDEEVAIQLQKEAEEMEIEIQRLEHDEGCRWHREMIEIIEEYRENTIELGEKCLERFGNMRIDLRERARETVIKEMDLLRSKYQQESTRIQTQLKETLTLCGDKMEMQNHILSVYVEQMHEDSKVNKMLLERAEEIINEYAQKENEEIGKFEDEAIAALGYKANLQIVNLKENQNERICAYGSVNNTVDVEAKVISEE